MLWPWASRALSTVPWLPASRKQPRSLGGHGPSPPHTGREEGRSLCA